MIIEVEGNNLTELLENLLKQLKAAKIINVCNLNKNNENKEVFLKNLKYKGTLEEIFQKIIENLLFLKEHCLVNLKIEKVKKIFNTNVFVIKTLLTLVREKEKKDLKKEFYFKNLFLNIESNKKYLVIEVVEKNEINEK